MEKEWQERFSLTSADYNEWKTSSTEDSFAIYAIKTNKIQPDQYQEWALHHYQIPFLNDSFFHNITIQQPLWERVKNKAKWSETFLPLYEWDNILFVACLKKPDQELKNMVPLLVSPKNMSLFWKKIQSFSSSVHKNQTDFEKEATLELSPSDRKNVTPNSSSQISHTNQSTDDTEVFSFSEENQKTGLFSKSTSLLNTVIKTTIGSSSQVQIQENEIYAQVFKLSEKYFTGVIIFSFQNKEFKPVEWSDSMEGPATPIKTDQPSVFRMIVKSRSPYHGFIINNSAHKKFFGPWGFKELPKHITLIPIFNNTKNIIGAFMGIADKNLPEKYLYTTTKWTGHLSKALTKPPTKTHKKSA